MLRHSSIISLVTLIEPSFVTKALVITISRLVKALLASPLAKAAMKFKFSSEISICSLPKPRESLNALFNNVKISSVANSFNTKTRHLESNALLISNEGFSVVAPINTIEPFSTNGKKASCWALLKR